LAGLVANFVAVPAMAIVQLAGLALLAPGVVAALAAPVVVPVLRAGVWALLESSRALGDVRWLSPRVPSPSWTVVFVFYASIGVLLWSARPGLRRGATAAGAVAAAWIVAGWSVPSPETVDGLARPRPDVSPPRLSMTTLDVGQGASVLVRVPGGEAVLVDAGGLAGSAFDMGARVVLPALWSMGVRRLAGLVVTHGDPDHVGGAPAVLDALRVDRVWDGIEVVGHEPTARVRALAAARGARVHFARAGERLSLGGARIRVLAPEPPAWERRAVRNDDSVVLEVRYGDVSIVIPGDAGAAVERAIAGTLDPAAVRVLVAGHHGSRTASSAPWIAAARPVAAIVSCGRDNRYGHPAPEALARYRAARVDVFRTDEDGAVALETDGREVQIATWSGRRARYVSAR
jgi:competence protein ComEC